MAVDEGVGEAEVIMTDMEGMSSEGEKMVDGSGLGVTVMNVSGYGWLDRTTDEVVVTMTEMLLLDSVEDARALLEGVGDNMLLERVGDKTLLERVGDNALLGLLLLGEGTAVALLPIVIIVLTTLEVRPVDWLLPASDTVVLGELVAEVAGRDEDDDSTTLEVGVDETPVLLETADDKIEDAGIELADASDRDEDDDGTMLEVGADEPPALLETADDADDRAEDTGMELDTDTIMVLDDGTGDTTTVEDTTIVVEAETEDVETTRLDLLTGRELEVDDTTLEKAIEDELGLNVNIAALKPLLTLAAPTALFS